MKAVIPYPYSNFRIIETPVTDPIDSERFIKLLGDGIRHIYRKKSGYKKAKVSINILDRYLKKYAISNVVPDEKFLILLKQRLSTEFTSPSGNVYGKTIRKQVISHIRNLINLYFLQEGIAKRQLLWEGVFGKYAKLLDLTGRTQEGIIWYSQEGKHIQSEKVLIQSDDGQPAVREVYSMTRKDLSSKVKEDRIARGLFLLNYCGKKGFEEITKEDIGNFRKGEGRSSQTAVEKDMIELLGLFSNLYERDFIDANPFIYFKTKSVASTARKDFITKEGIGKLMDLSTLDFSDAFDVRDRAICLFLYDTAMRLGEIRLLLCSDIEKEDENMFRITLRSEIQKGSKDSASMYLYFEQTKKILAYYMTNARDSFSPKCDSLFLSMKGYGISEGRVLRIVKTYCKKLDVKTYFNKIPSPHVFRHTFPTLNITPLPFGLRLPLEAIVERLRHVGQETAKKYYIHENPYIKKLKHIEYQKQGEKGSILDKLPFDEIQAWLSKISVPKHVIEIVEKAHSHCFIDKPNENRINYISEQAAIEMVKALRIKKPGLRKYCLSNNLCKQEENGNCLYNKDFITDLAEGWLTKDNVMEKTRRSRSRFYNDLREMGWGTLTIGHVLLIKKSDFTG